MEINAHNYKEVLLQWLEGELSPTEVLQAEAFILVNEAAAKEWQLLQKTKLQPAQQVFFPKKHLLMKEEDKVAAAPIVTPKVFEEEAVIRTISGGFNYRKFALPMSIAASLLLFFFFFTNRNVIENNGNGAVAQADQVQNQPVNKNEVADVEKSSKEIIKSADKKLEINSETSQMADAGLHKTLEAKTLNKENAEGRKENKNKVFSEGELYGNENNMVYNKPVKQELQIVKVEIPTVETGTEINKITKPRKSLVKQSQEEEQWQQAENKRKQELAMGPADDVERGIIGKLTHFFTKNVDIKKSTEDDVNYYAFRLETENIKIVKTFKSTF